MVFDSYLHPILNDSGGQNPGGQVRGAAVFGGTVTLVNSRINLSDGGYGTCGTIVTGRECAGAEVPNPSLALIKVYGGSISTKYVSGGVGGASGGAYDLMQRSSGEIEVNSTAGYNSLNVYGTVGSLGTAPYGAYSYPGGPMPVPGNWING